MKQTKAQQLTIARLERRGYDYSHDANGNPVMTLRPKRIWVEVLRNGAYRPA